jgi:PAS domain-containing protein
MMTANQFGYALDYFRQRCRAGLDKTGHIKAVAAHIGRSPRLVYHWLDGSQPIPPSVEALIRIMFNYPELTFPAIAQLPLPSDQPIVRRSVMREYQLQDARELFGLMTYTRDLKTGEMIWDPALKALWGLGPDDQVTDDIWRQGVHPDDRDRIQQYRQRALNPMFGVDFYDIEHRVINLRDGSERRVVARSRILFHRKAPVLITGVLIDVCKSGKKR